MTDSAVAAMLEARSVALVGASARPDSFGARMISEVGRGDPNRGIHLVNPRYDRIGEQRCSPTLADIGEPVELVMLGVNDAALVAQLRSAAEIGARAAVVFGSAHGVRDELRAIATEARMALCGAGCMGFVNISRNLRVTGYVERAEIPRGPIALITHSGSMFSALLRTRRALGYTLAVSSGQELVTTTADYLEYVLERTDTKVVALVLETVRDGPRFVAALRRAAARDLPVVLLPVGASELGSSLVTAHSGALAGSTATWEALAEGTGALLVDDLAELTDTLELLAIDRRAPHARGIATVHDSGAERSLVADTAERLGVPYAPIGEQSRSQIGSRLDPGLVAENPLDLWGVGAGTRALFSECLQALADDPAVSAVALAIDLVEEYDGDTSYPDAALDVRTDKPLVVLANLPSALDDPMARRLRAAGIPVLEGTRSGLVALRHLLALAERANSAEGFEPAECAIDLDRRDRWLARLAEPQQLDGAESFALLADYGVAATEVGAVDSADDAVRAADELGYPVVLKTDDPAVAHKSDAGGVVLDLADSAAVRDAYAAIAERLGPRALLCATAEPGIEMSVGLIRDPQLGPLVVLAAGGTLAELLADRAVALPPLTHNRAEALLDRLRITTLLDGWRGAKPADRDALVDIVVRVGQLAAELGDHLAALDVNPVIVTPAGALAVDVLVQPA